jgi:hypothetical protein
VTPVNQHLVRQARTTRYTQWTVDPCEVCGRPAVDVRCRACRTVYIAWDEGGWMRRLDADSMEEACEEAADVLIASASASVSRYVLPDGECEDCEESGRDCECDPRYRSDYRDCEEIEREEVAPR